MAQEKKFIRLSCLSQFFTACYNKLFNAGALIYSGFLLLLYKNETF